MSVCNLFRELKRDTGNFLSFSQYADDLTRYYVQHNDYKAIPSRFIVCDLDCSKLDNKSLPTKLQNYFENACAYFRSKDGDNYTPETTKNIFWSVFGDMLGELKEAPRDTNSKDTNSKDTNNNLQYKYFDAIKYIGDINIQSYEEKDGIGYNEIYCYIPNDAQCTHYEVVENTIKDVELYNNKFIMGFDSTDKIVGMLDIEVPYGIKYSRECKYQLYHKDQQSSNSSASLLPHTTDDRKFDFNTIIVLYDIMSKDSSGVETIKYKDIPLGIFFTGTIVDGVMTNSITKYVQNDDIYGAGTSYGLRLCTRFTCTPNATEINEVSIESSNQYAGFVQVMEACGQTISETRRLLSNLNTYENDIKQHLSAFKNYRTNIPYVRRINDIPYWFVNGKNTGVELSYHLTEDDKQKIVEEIYNRIKDRISEVVDEKISTLPIMTYEDMLGVFNK